MSIVAMGGHTFLPEEILVELNIITTTNDWLSGIRDIGPNDIEAIKSEIKKRLSSDERSIMICELEDHIFTSSIGEIRYDLSKDIPEPLIETMYLGMTIDYLTSEELRLIIADNNDENNRIYERDWVDETEAWTDPAGGIHHSSSDDYDPTEMYR